ncbi:MAG TPA: magnesium chelatase subunit D family protein [Coriobacteriia bacterium]
MPRRQPHVFPFSALVGQETLKTALLLNAIDPRVGGVLIRGEKGTAKSTAVRALAGLLPEIAVVEGCRFGCDPADRRSWCEECAEAYRKDPAPVAKRRPRFVDLPVSATEDRLVGTLDLEHALKHGERRFDAGLLADANRGVLYVDEVNLLEDHLVDTLLDSAAMGVNVVEREGVAFSHPARFILVGTMNPEEGEVRPQLLDRFGLCVDVEGLASAAERVEVIRRRTAFEDDPDGFLREWQPGESGVAERIDSAQERLRDTEMPDDLLFLIATISAEMGVDGHRSDLVMARAATALAALEASPCVTPEHVRTIAPLVLAHRLRRRPFEETTFDAARLDSIVGSSDGEEGVAERPGAQKNTPGGEGGTAALVALVHSGDGAGGDADTSARLDADLDRLRRRGSGRRQETRSDDGRGRYVRAEPPRAGAKPDLALDATIRAAAPYQQERAGEMAVRIEPQDIRSKVRKRRVGASIVFCVDASGSMGASTRMEATKSAILDLLVDAYQRRDRVGLVSFRGESADVLLAPTGSVELAQLKLRDLATGGATPLAHGIIRSLEVLSAETRRNDSTVPWLVLVTDGRANVGIGGGLGSEDARAAAAKVRESRVHSMLIDTNGAGASGAARELARLAGGDYVRLGTFAGTSIAGAVRERLEAL